VRPCSRAQTSEVIRPDNIAARSGLSVKDASRAKEMSLRDVPFAAIEMSPRQKVSKGVEEGVKIN
jgi:hypothetical protein